MWCCAAWESRVKCGIGGDGLTSSGEAATSADWLEIVLCFMGEPRPMRDGCRCERSEKSVFVGDAAVPNTRAMQLSCRHIGKDTLGLKAMEVRCGLRCLTIGEGSKYAIRDMIIDSE